MPSLARRGPVHGLSALRSGGGRCGGGCQFGFVLLGTFLTLLVWFCARAYMMYKLGGRSKVEQWISEMRPTSGPFGARRSMGGSSTSGLAAADSNAGSYTGPLQVTPLSTPYQASPA